NQLQRERAECRRRVKPVREMLNVPSDPRRQRTILVLLIHRREVSPLGIATCNFCDARFKVNSEPFPEQKEHAGANRRMPAAESRTPSRWREEPRNKSRLQQHAVRLIAGEFRSRAHERKETHKAHGEHAAWPNIEGHEYGA